ncbi:MAG: iron ABC transporter permease [Pseudomonadota bacterium]
MVIVAGIIAAPVLVIISSLFDPFSELWRHLLDHVITDYIVNSLLLMLGVALGTSLLGVTTAWLTATCEFPGRRFFGWALVLPMAMPAYIIAYTYTGMLDFSGPLQSYMRETFDWQYGDYWFPEIRSLGGAICMLSLVFYPYVYLLARVAFAERSTALLEASRNLGHGPWRTALTVALPMARPAIIAGVSLALMETLADYGTVDYFGISVFTTGIFRTWYGFGELTTAAQLAAFLLLFVVTVVVLERLSRGAMRFNAQNARAAQVRVSLVGWRARLCCALASAVVIAGFALPAAQLGLWVMRSTDSVDAQAFLSLVGNSFLLAAIASLCALVVALALAYAVRLRPGRLATLTVATASIGYAVPGTVIAVGVLISLAWADNQLNNVLQFAMGSSGGLLLSGSLAALVFAYLVRFLTVSMYTVESGLSKITPTLDDAARSLGRSPRGVLRDVHVPLLRGSVLTALLLVFVDVLKELPATLILRPFNFNTLAVRTYELASDERLMDAALPALTIVVIGLVPVILLSRGFTIGRGQHG